MTMVSRLALAAAVTLVATSAAAQTRPSPTPSPTPAPQLQVSNNFRRAGSAAETAIAARDWPTAETQLAAAEGIARNDDERYFVAVLRLKIEIGKNSSNPDDPTTPGALRALDDLIANPRTPAANLPEYLYVRGRATFVGGERAASVPFLLRARELGYSEADTSFMLAQAYVDAGRIVEGVAEMGRAIDAMKASGRAPQVSWYEYAIAKIYGTGDRAATTVWMIRLIRDFPTIQNWRRAIVLLRESTGTGGVTLTNAQKIDLFRLMRRTGALADQADHFEYANFALQAGLPWESVAVIDEGRRSGKIPANDAIFNQVYTAAQAGVRSEGSLDTLAREAAGAANGVAARATGDAFLASGGWARALELYDLALQKGGVDANEVNLHRGVALVQLERRDEARTAFALVTQSPLSEIARFWVFWLDMPPLAGA